MAFQAGFRRHPSCYRAATPRATGHATSRYDARRHRSGFRCCPHSCQDLHPLYIDHGCSSGAHAWLSGSRHSALNSYALHLHYAPACQILALSTVIFLAGRPCSAPSAGRGRKSGRVGVTRGRERFLDAHALGLGICDEVLHARRPAPQSNAQAARMVRRGGRRALEPGMAATS